MVAEGLREMQKYTMYKNAGGHGLAAVCQNGPGPVVMHGADMDAPPMLEQTYFPYASGIRQKDQDGVEQPVMHAYGHDMHIIPLLVAVEVSTSDLLSWSGTLVLIFQPAEQKGSGSDAMIRDGLYDRIQVPHVVLGQHITAQRVGHVEPRYGQILSASDSSKVTFYGHGGHGSAPESAIDPS